jgi:hypothetical protein
MNLLLGGNAAGDFKLKQMLIEARSFEKVLRKLNFNLEAK